MYDDSKKAIDWFPDCGRAHSIQELLHGGFVPEEKRSIVYVENA
jgi:hypothetical protein